MRDGEGRRIHCYVGPAEVLAAARLLAPGRPVLAREDIPGADEPCTFVIDLEGTPLLAPRRSEHVACAGGGPVLSAGEITFEPGSRRPEGQLRATAVAPVADDLAHDDHRGDQDRHRGVGHQQMTAIHLASNLAPRRPGYIPPLR